MNLPPVAFSSIVPMPVLHSGYPVRRISWYIWKPMTQNSESHFCSARRCWVLFHFTWSLASSAAMFFCVMATVLSSILFDALSSG